MYNTSLETISGMLLFQKAHHPLFSQKNMGCKLETTSYFAIIMETISEIIFWSFTDFCYFYIIFYSLSLLLSYLSTHVDALWMHQVSKFFEWAKYDFFKNDLHLKWGKYVVQTTPYDFFLIWVCISTFVHEYIYGCIMDI